jgi:hypothetical protein
VAMKVLKTTEGIYRVKMPLPKDMAITWVASAEQSPACIAEVVCSVSMKSTEKLMRADSHNGTTSPCEASGG